MEKIRILLSGKQRIEKYVRAVEAAYWNNKYAEAIEHTTLPIFRVQWHPERMCLSEARGDTVSGLPIFEHFVSLCKEKRGVD